MTLKFGGNLASPIPMASRNQTRRQLMTALAGLPLAGATQASDLAEAGMGRPDKPLSWSPTSRAQATRAWSPACSSARSARTCSRSCR